MKKALSSTVLLLFIIELFAQQAVTGSSRFKFLPANPKNNLLADIENARAVSKTDTAAAVKLYRAIIKEAKADGDDYYAGLAYFEMAEMHAKYGQHNKSFGGYFNARPFFEKLGAQVELAYTYYGLGREQFHRGSFNPAANHLNYAILYANRNNLKQLEADAQEYLALLYNEISYFNKKGNLLLRRALKIREELGDERGIALVLSSLSRGFYLQKNYDSALLYIDRSISISRSHEMKHLLASGLMEKTEILLRLDRNAEARQQLLEVSNLSFVFTERNLLIRYLTTMGNILLDEGHAEAAKIQYDSAIKLAKTADTPNSLAIVFGRMSESYSLKGDFKNAYECQKEFNNLFTKLFVNETVDLYESSEFLLSKKMSDDEVLYLQAQNQLKQLKLQREIEIRNGLISEKLLMDSLLAKEKLLNEASAREGIYKDQQIKNEKALQYSLRNANTMQEAALSNERNLRGVLSIALGVAALLGAIIFWQYRRQKRKNQIIRRQADELNTLMKEIHHRVKNNLQVISSLLDLQSLTIKDEQASVAVKEGRNRVQSMALLHQHLYTEGNIKGIRVKEYINSLVQGLFSSFDADSSRLNLNMDVEDLNLDVDTVIPLGLILNELISNSLKYAFGRDVNGEIVVQLSKSGDKLTLKVRDNGPGFPPQVHELGHNSFGMKLIRAFAQKLKARLEIYNDEGAVVEMHITRFKMAEEVVI